MTRWLTRFWWGLRGYCEVRVQYADGSGAVDGVLVGVDKKYGHYMLRNASFIAPNPDVKPAEMLGETWVPRERVMCLNVRR